MQQISARVDEEIGWIAINRPELRNAITKDMWLAIPRLLEQCVEQGARLIVIEGEGGAFAAGADFSDLQQLSSRESVEKLWGAIREALNAVAHCELPTIAKVVGPCMGGGCLLAVACDMRFCEPSARFSVPVAQLGITLDEDNVGRLVALVGKGVSAELLFTGSVFTAARAEECGLVNAMVPGLELNSLIVGLAENIRRCSPDSIRHLKKTIVSLSNRGRVEQDQAPVIDSYMSDEFKSRIKKVSVRNT